MPPKSHPFVYQIISAGPGKLLNEPHIAENQQLVGANQLLRAEWRIETADQVACTARDASLVKPERWGPLEREVLEYRPEYEVAKDMGMAQVGAEAGNG